MRTFVYWCLGLSIALEIFVVLRILNGSAGVPLSLAYPVVLLLVSTVLVLVSSLRYWESMGTPEKSLVSVAAGAPVLPIAVTVAYLVVILVAIVIGVILTIVLAIILLGASSGPDGSGGGQVSYVPYQGLRDRHGYPVAWMDLVTWELTDGHGRHQGWVNRFSGEITDEYDVRSGWMSRNGDITDPSCIPIGRVLSTGRVIDLNGRSG